MHKLHLTLSRPPVPRSGPRPTLPCPLGGILALALVAGIGCDADAGNVATAVVRDSAGVEIVFNPGPVTDVPAGWAIDPEPILSIGSVEGDDALQFHGISGIHRLSDGRIGVVNIGSREVRFFDPYGGHLRSFGKQGGGPEEFQMPVLAGAIGDTLIIVDQALHRLTFVHPDLGFVGLARVADEVGGFLNPIGTLTGGQSVFGGAMDPRGTGEIKSGMNRARTFYRSCNPDGSLAADFGNKAGAEFFMGDAGGDAAPRPSLIPFGKEPVAAASPSHFFFSDQDEWEIEVHTADGTLVRLIRQEWEPEPVTSEDGSRYVEEMAAQAEEPDMAARIRQRMRDLPLPEDFPAFGNLQADQLDYLWVQDLQRPGEDAPAWTLFDPDGVRAGRLTLPQGFYPIEIGLDFILGVGRDDLGVEYVRMYALERPPRG